MAIRYLLFDLDETLYPRDAGVMQAIGRLIRQYIVQEYGMTPDEADALARRYHQEYGTSMRGLLLNNNLDVDRFLAYVHDFPLDLLQPNRELDALLASLPGEKVIFTNADRPHAERVLAQLGIRRHFSRIVDVVANGYIPKPSIDSLHPLPAPAGCSAPGVRADRRHRPQPASRPSSSAWSQYWLTATRMTAPTTRFRRSWSWGRWWRRSFGTGWIGRLVGW